MIRILWLATAASLGTVSPQAAEAQEPGTETAAESFDSTAAWQEFEDTLRLFYAYIDREDMDVEAQLQRSKAAALATTDKGSFRKVLHQTALTFSDPHFLVGPLDATDYSIIPSGSDIKTVLRDGRFYILDVRAGSAADKAGVRPGWEIVNIDGQSVGQAAQRPYGDLLANPTPRQLVYGADIAVSGLRNKPRNISFRHGSKIHSISLAATYDHSDEIRAGELLSISQQAGIGVIRINNSLGNNDLIPAFDRAVEQLSDSDAIIVDLRNTPGGGNTEVARSIIGHFVTETRSYQIHEIPSLEREFTVPRRFIEQVKPRIPLFPGPVVVLGGHWTGSMGEGLVIGLDAAADAYTIASDMGDLLGALSNLDLRKSGARMDIGTESLFHVNGTPREDYLADLPLRESDRLADGSDPAMAAAMEYLKRIITTSQDPEQPAQ
ncbi:MAG: S41 family peptidase [Pseudomonadota bacterium]